MRVVFTTVAQDDLRAIGDYIAQDNPLRAYNFIAEIKGACLSLQYHPRRFPVAPRYADGAVRKRVFGRYLIFYRIGIQTIDILHIVHGAADLDAIV